MLHNQHKQHGGAYGHTTTKDNNSSLAGIVYPSKRGKYKIISLSQIRRDRICHPARIEFDK